MKLISMVDFVLKSENNFNKGEIGFKEFTNIICNYANFLKQPLKLGMFVPCDENDNILEYISKPKLWEDYLDAPECLDGYFGVDDCYKYENYLKAKENVIFEGLKVIHINDELIKISISDKLLLKFYIEENSIFLYEKHYGRVSEIKTIEDLIPYNLEINKQF